MTELREQLQSIRTFPSLVRFLRDELDWPVETEDFEELTFDYSPEELGIDAANAAKIDEIKRLRPLVANQPWSIFFVKFEPKRLPVVALRRILAGLVVKKRATASAAEQPKWAEDDLLFISNYGEGDQRQITFAHFSQSESKHDLPTLKVLGWDNLDTPLHLDDVAEHLTQNLAWPEDDNNIEAWRAKWSAAFTLGHRQVITTSKQLSIRLAELARAIRDRITTALAIETEDGPLTKLMTAFQVALVHDLDAGGFADMYAQTIAYGLLSARIADPHKRTADDFASHMRTNPFLRELMETFLKIGGRRGGAGEQSIDFDELGVSDVVQLLDNANMEAVVRDFGDRNPEEDPVIHFYELFLKEYDAKKRMQRGVFYTPRPVVSYIVRSVDELLRAEFGLEDGLADTTTWGEMAERHNDLTLPEGVPPTASFVRILDPATGTGTFLVEVVDIVHKTLVAKWRAQGHSDHEIAGLWNDYVPKHLLPRLHGYELLMAPYAIAHLKIGLKLFETGYRFESDERARIYLTNSLEPPSDIGQMTLEGLLPALAHEAQAVNRVKQEQRFTVVLGNPPYANFGRLNKIPFILSLLEDYKRGLGEKKINLDDDFIKFVRFCQFTIDSTSVAVIGVITNNSFIDGITHRQMRHSLLESFAQIWIRDLHGSAKKRERQGDGLPEENVFDIQQGVAISLLVKPFDLSKVRSVAFSELWGTRDSKYQQLSQEAALDGGWEMLHPTTEMYFFTPKQFDSATEYLQFTSLGDALREWISGVQSKRDDLFIGFTRKEVALRMAAFLDPDRRASDPDAEAFVGSSGGWIVEKSHGVDFDESRIRPIQLSPFDVRFIYYEPRLLGRARFEVMKNMVVGNVGLVFMRQSANQGEYDHALAVSSLVTDRVFYSASGAPFLAPLYLLGDEGGERLTLREERESNLTPAFVTRIEKALSLGSGARYDLSPESAFRYLYAVLYSRGYRSRYNEYLRIDYPRIPAPGSPLLFEELVRLGGELLSVHLMAEASLPPFETTYVGPKNPAVGRVGWSDGTVWLDAATTKRLKGGSAPTAGFSGVPEGVWSFHLGGYQICQKWLKDRKGRFLSDEDIAHFQKIVVALSETIRLMTEIDEVIEEQGGWPDAFAASESAAHV